jgi:hypothetical protein
MVIIIFTIVKAGYRAELLLEGFKRDGITGGAPNGAFINRQIGIVEILLGRSLFLFLDRNLDTSQSSASREPAPPLPRTTEVWLSFGSSLLRPTHPSH